MYEKVKRCQESDVFYYDNRVKDMNFVVYRAKKSVSKSNLFMLRLFTFSIISNNYCVYTIYNRFKKKNKIKIKCITLYVVTCKIKFTRQLRVVLFNN